ncbi:MAG: hypothetical protein ACE5K0_08080 [Candidatus Methanofastidiosia archaeon]
MNQVPSENIFKYKEIPAKITRTIQGILECFLLGEDGELLEHNGEISRKNVEEIFSSITYLVDVLRKKNSFKKMWIKTHEKNFFIFSFPGSYYLCFVTAGEVNLPLINFVIQKILKEIPKLDLEETEISEITEVYGKLFECISFSMFKINGKTTQKIFRKRTEEVRENYKEVFGGVDFDENGMLDLSKIRENIQRQPYKSYTLAALNEFLSSLLKCISSIGGQKIMENTMKEISNLKEKYEEQMRKYSISI